MTEYFVARTCTDRTTQESILEKKHIAEFRNLPAYVLLGEPGAGKTKLFEQEAESINELPPISVREFVTVFDKPKWKGHTLFIDGLDEKRSGESDGRNSLDELRKKLHELGYPRFRLACRAADWLATDLEALRSCVPEGKIAVLYLDPLTDENKKEILQHSKDIKNVDAFMRSASEWHLKELLGNPQNLKMLIDIVKAGVWPNSKQEMYQHFCEKLILEWNLQHIDAQKKRQQYSPSELLDAAGYLYAVSLLADASIFVETPTNEQSQIYINTLGIPDNFKENAILRQVVKSRLFKSVGVGKFAASHRSVAEFLAAKFLAARIESGLPLKRVLALMSNHGTIASTLRGLLAWLSVHCRDDFRNQLIALDPLAVVLYGDVQNFSIASKEKLLVALQHNPVNSFDYNLLVPSAFAALTTAEMTAQLVNILSQCLHNKDQQQVLLCLMMGLLYSKSIPELKLLLLTIISGQVHAEDVRQWVLKAFMQQYSDDKESLLQLAKDIRSNKIQDYQHGLMNLLLADLYPNIIDNNQIFDYISSNINPINYVNNFWSYTFVELVNDQDIAILLDELVKRDLNFSDYELSSMAGKLLMRGLSAFGNAISNTKLYQWLSLGLEYGSSHFSPEIQQKIRNWLNKNPTHYLALLEIGINKIHEPQKAAGEINIAYAHLYAAKKPENLGSWWLKKVISSNDNILKQHYFRQAVENLAPQNLANWLQQHPQYVALDEKEQAEKQAHQKLLQKYQAPRQQEKQARIAYFRPHLSAIQAGTANPSLLYQLATAYLGYPSDLNKTMSSAGLAEFFYDDKELITATESGLRKIIKRTDLPQPTTIFALAVESKRHPLSLPLLICISILTHDDPAFLTTLSDELITIILAFWLTYASGQEPSWIKLLSITHPELTAKIMLEYVTTLWMGKVPYIHGLYQLAYDPAYREVAQHTVIPLLKKYPVRSTTTQAASLEHLLIAALKLAVTAEIDKSGFLALIAKKLAQKSMDILQRVYWLTAGLIIDPGKYTKWVRDYVSAEDIRRNHFAKFLCKFDHLQTELMLPPSTLGLIFELLASQCKPLYAATHADLIATIHATQEKNLVHHLLEWLSEDATEQSMRVIEQLLASPLLVAWHEYLRVMQRRQRIHRLEAAPSPQIEHVVQTLNKLKPANVADLAAITMDSLQEINRAIRGDTDGYKQFWNTDSDKHRDEHSCCNILVDKLRNYFSKLDVDVQLESHEANDKRADIRITFRQNGKKFHLPVEMKLSNNSTLWSALREQLLEKYAIDPAAHGRGIYLVVWLGFCTRKKINTIDELKSELMQSLSPAEQNLIDIFVLDVAQPKLITVSPKGL